ncbi:MAG: hypothetical protein K2P68_04620 [Sphingomonas sp.]|nr:hypothetical protein [Sphingomonas sp.]
MRALFTKAVAGSMIVGAALALSACNKTETTTTDNAMVSEMNTTDEMATDNMTATDGAMASNDAMMSSNDAMMSSNDAMATNAQ